MENEGGNFLKEKDIEAAKKVLSKRGSSSIVEIIHLSKTTVMKETSFTEEQAAEFLFIISSQLCANVVNITAHEMFNTELYRRRLSSGCAKIDAFLKGGFLPRGITEIFGAAGSGKTQLCLQLLFQAQLPFELNGLEGSSLYICSEGPHPKKRLLSFAQTHKRRFSCTDDPMAKIFVENVSNLEILWDILEKRLPVYIHEQNVKLVIIDSIAALCRHEFSNKDSIERSQVLWRHANQLKLLADSFQMVVITINQAAADFKSNPYDYSNSDHIIPALGLPWSNCVNTRIMLNKLNKRISFPENGFLDPERIPGTKKFAGEESKDNNDKGNNNNNHKPDLNEMKKSKVPGINKNNNENNIKNETNSNEVDLNIREMHIIFSPHLPNKTLQYVVDGHGVWGI
jgi:RecA/RadA recombinase